MAGAPQFSTDHFALKLGLFYAAYFFFGGVQLPFFPLWLEARGLDAATIGLVIAVPTLVRIVATPVISHQADRHRAIKAVLVIGSIAGALAMTVVGLVEGAIAILIAFALAMAALAPMLSLTDAYALNGLGVRGRTYGPVRLWGSVAFIAGNVGAGLILEVIAPGHLIWLIVSALLVLVAAAAALVPLDVVAKPGEESAPRSPKTLLRSPAFLTVALASSLVQGSHALYYGFSTLEWRAAGLDGTVIGVLWGLGVVAEIVLFACSGRLPGALRPTALLAIGGAGIYMGLMCAAVWILPLFDAQPMLAPIYNPVKHMVPPAFPLLLIVPAVAMDLIFRWIGRGRGWRRDLLLVPLLATAFTGLFTLTQWHFSKHLISPEAENWFFNGSGFFTFADRRTDSWNKFWNLNADPLTAKALLVAWVVAVVMSAAGLAVGNWMSKVKR